VNGPGSQGLLLSIVLTAVAGCDIATDAATRLASDIEAGETVSSHSTPYHARFVDTPQTYLLEKPMGTTLTSDLERRGSRAVITAVR